MSTYKLHLTDEPFDKIVDGNKRIELRLYDEKRRKIKVGDTLEFEKLSDGLSFSAEVKAIHKFKNFKELFGTDLFVKCGCGNMTVDEAVQAMREYYSEEQEAKYGVVGIEFEPLWINGCK